MQYSVVCKGRLVVNRGVTPEFTNSVTLLFANLEYSLMLSQICSRVQRGAGQPNPGGVKCFGVDETGTGTLLRTKNKQTGKKKKTATASPTLVVTQFSAKKRRKLDA